MSGVAVSSKPGELPPGTYSTRNLLGGRNGTVLKVGVDGAVNGYVPLRGAIGAHESLVLDATRPTNAHENER